MPKQVIAKYLRLINDYPASGQQFEYLYIEALKNQFLTPEAKRLLGLPTDAGLTLYDLPSVRKGLEIMPQLRFVYLTSLVEGFVEEYLSAREIVPAVGLDQLLRSDKANWVKANQRQPVASSSYLNLLYVRHLFNERYSLTYKETPDYFWEIGMLRNIVVHSDGVIDSEPYRDAMKRTIALFGVPDAVGSRLAIDGVKLFNYIEAARKFLAEC